MTIALLPPPGADDALYLFDLSCWMFRYYATMKGRAAHGFLDFVGKILYRQRPAYVAVAGDLPCPTFRHDIAPGVYKAQRPAKDGTILERLRWARELLEDVHGIRTYERMGFEADDVIATMTKRAVADGMRVVIIALDKDLMQLVSDRVVMWDGKKKVMGPVDVLAKFGVRPDQLGDYLAIVGDSCDNIAGLPGAGPKVAVEILQAFGSLDRALAATGIICPKPELFRHRPRYRALLIDGAENARLSKRLTDLASEVPLDYARESLRWSP